MLCCVLPLLLLGLLRRVLRLDGAPDMPPPARWDVGRTVEPGTVR